MKHFTSIINMNNLSYFWLESIFIYVWVLLARHQIKSQVYGVSITMYFFTAASAQPLYMNTGNCTVTLNKLNYLDCNGAVWCGEEEVGVWWHLHYAVYVSDYILDTVDV